MIDLVANRREANRTKFSTPYLGPRTSSKFILLIKMIPTAEKPGMPGIVLIDKAGHQIKADANGIKISTSQSCTGALRYPTCVPYSGTGLVLASAFLFIPVPDWPDAGQSGIPAFKMNRLSYCIWLAKSREWHARQCKELRDGWLAFLEAHCIAECVRQLTKDRTCALMLGWKWVEVLWVFIKSKGNIPLS